MTLREFLIKNVPRTQQERRRRQACEEWVNSVARLLIQIRAWLKDAEAVEFLDVEPLTFEKREQGIGGYTAPGLAIHFGESTVKLLPIGRAVLAPLGTFAEPGHTNADGRVDITNGSARYHLFLNRTAEKEEWLIQDDRADYRLLDRGQFEAILQDLLA